MTPAARSIYIFGLYLIVVGGHLTGTPNTLFALVGLPATTQPWAHATGVPVVGMGMLFAASARAELEPFMRATVWTRVFVLVAFIMLAVVRNAPPVRGCSSHCGPFE